MFLSLPWNVGDVVQYVGCIIAWMGMILIMAFFYFKKRLVVDSIGIGEGT